MDESCGNLFIKRSVCVPFPTPGAPTSITRAALESAILFYTVSSDAWRRCRSRWTDREGRLGSGMEAKGLPESARGALANVHVGGMRELR